MVCTFVDHENPYLKIGPFKFEEKHQDPEIAIVHDFASRYEVSKLIQLSKGNLKATPYVEYDGQISFSKERTSKIMYLNEEEDSEIMPLSDKIEHLTQLKLKSEEFASENFQLMNYGIGGKISPHVDSPGFDFSNTQRETGKSTFQF